MFSAFTGILSDLSDFMPARPPPSSFSKPFYITFIFCPAKSESRNRQRGVPMRQQIKRRVERLPLPCPAIAFGDGGTPSSFSKPFHITFVFCSAKSESGNRQRGVPMRQQIKRRGCPSRLVLRQSRKAYGRA